MFLGEHIQDPSNPDNIYEITEKQLEEMDSELISYVEADAYWCLTKMIDDIQDNYIEYQPGVHKIINKMKVLIEQKDEEAMKFLESIDISFMDFAYRWVTCYLMREFSIYQIIRFWDTYFAEDEAFS